MQEAGNTLKVTLVTSAAENGEKWVDEREGGKGWEKRQSGNRKNVKNLWRNENNKDREKNNKKVSQLEVL